MKAKRFEGLVHVRTFDATIQNWSTVTLCGFPVRYLPSVLKDGFGTCHKSRRCPDCQNILHVQAIHEA